MKYLIIFLIMDYNVLTKTCYKVHISSKSQTWMAIQASKTCKVWISLNPNIFYSGCVGILGSISLSFTTFPKFYDRVFPMILLWFTIAKLPLQCWLLPAGLKVFPATSFYNSSFWVSRGTGLLFMNCHSPSFLVLCCTTGCLRRTYLFFVSCISWYLFWAVSIPL